MTALLTAPCAAPASPRDGAPVVVYGRRWCAYSRLTCRDLDELGVSYDYVDLDEDPRASSRLWWITEGRPYVPVVTVGGDVLVQPGPEDLRRALGRGPGVLSW